MTTFNVGDYVRIERDETLYPSKVTWPQFRGNTGTVVEVNEDRKRPHLTEYGVCFRKVGPFPGRPGQLYRDGTTTWFKTYELFLTSVRHAEPVRPSPTSDLLASQL
jgi:hypothetical protein